MEQHPQNWTLQTVRQFVEKHPHLTEAALRDLIFKSVPRVIRGNRHPGNGMAPAIIRFGRRVYVDPVRFRQLLDENNLAPSQTAPLGAGNE
jgi:hypothetical protein